MSNVRIVLDDAGGFFSVPDAEVLIVLLHAYNRTPKNLQRIAEVVREEYESSDVYAPRIPVNLFSWADPDTIAAGLIDDLAKLPRIDSYRSIVLVGHSLGAVMARKIWAIANGATPAATVETGNTRTWADKIDRIVLVAALNRGWMVSSALDPARRLSWTLGAAWGNICRYLLKREPAIFGFRRGAPFLTMVRLQCLAVAAAMPAKLPMVVQLLGTADDYVAPTDNLDLATGRDFHYIEVAEATHGGLVDLDDSHGPNSALASFRLALKGDAASLKDRSLKLDDVFDVY
jgi:pimeloyl-ACP methyl ester carboxylesterase